MAIIIDSWFPFTGGAQVHVYELQRVFATDHRVDYTIYAPRKIQLWYRLIWTLVIPLIIYRDHKKNKYDLIHSHGFQEKILQ